MKKLIFFIMIPFCVLSQTVNEKSIFRFDDLPNVEASSLKFDEKTGTYLYSDYDTTTKKTTIYSNKGNSATYDYVDYYYAVIDGNGNYYAVADNNITDTTFEYFILKNGKEIVKYDYVNTFWKEKNGLIYFQCKDEDTSYLNTLDISTGNITKGKAYDDVILCSFPPVMEEEEEGELGFTNDGKPYYIAKLNNEAFLVIGTEEQKHYSDIDAYSFKTDPSGNFCYVAKDKGVFYNAGNSFVVQGDKQYKKFDYINTPIIFDESGTAVYVGYDSAESTSPQRVMIGDKEASKTYDGGLYNVQYSPDKKLYFIASAKKKNSDDYASFVVYDGKEGKRYQSIGLIKVLPNNELLYIANINDKEQVIVRGNKEIEPDYPTILDMTVLPNGKFAYIGGSYGDYDKKTYDKFFIQIGDDELGPYDDFVPINYETNDYVSGDASGNYVYLIDKLINVKDYTFRQDLYYNSKKIGDFDEVENVTLYKGKPLYTASDVVDKVNNIYKYHIYYNGKAISQEYDSIDEYKFDEASGTITFTGTRGKEFFKVEIKM